VSPVRLAQSDTDITNVYNKTVVVNNNNRVAFNGGNGGVQARPTVAEEAAMKQPHEERTAEQTRNFEAAKADPQMRAQMTVGPLETPGSSSTPRAQGYRSSDFSVVSGASVRLVMDVGAWDNSVAMNSPGQSDDPMSAHYRDLFPMWAQGSYVPLRFTRAAVDEDAEDLIHLTPGR